MKHLIDCMPIWFLVLIVPSATLWTLWSWVGGWHWALDYGLFGLALLVTALMIIMCALEIDYKRRR